MRRVILGLWLCGLCALALLPGARPTLRPFTAKEEARRYIEARLAASPGAAQLADAYAATFTRVHKTESGASTAFLLVGDADHERGLADALFDLGFRREALFHYENLADYFPQEPRPYVIGRIRECLQAPPSKIESAGPVAEIGRDWRAQKIGQEEARSRLLKLPASPERDHLLAELGTIDFARFDGWFGLDGRWLLALRRNPAVKFVTRNRIATGETLPVEAELRNVDRVTFQFSRVTLTGTAPQPTAFEPHRNARLPIEYSVERAASDKFDLPLREPGIYRITARAGELQTAFFGVRTQDRVEAAVFPAGLVLRASRGGRPIEGLWFYQGKTRFGPTDANGCTRYAQLRAGVCAEHIECCASCESCLHHHADGSPPIGLVAVGPDTIFTAYCSTDLKPVAEVTSPPAGPLLFLYTDRPTYRAGDSLRFRGILRSPDPELKEERYLSCAGETVEVSILRGGDHLLRRECVTGDHGTFSGEFTLPLSASREEYELEVRHGGSTARQIFEVRDYRKSEHAVFLDPVDGGFRVRAGYVWGAEVPGSTIECLVDGVKTEPKAQLVSARVGQKVKVVLSRDGQVLAEKETTVAAPRIPSPPRKAEDSPAKETGAPKAERKTVESDLPLLTAEQVGDEIRIELRGGREALVVLGDLQPYDWRVVEMVDGRAQLRMPARGVHDPGTWVNAVLDGERVERVPVRVCTRLLPVEIAPSKTSARPGESIDVLLKSRPGAALSLAAVDEAIFSLREDATPDMYETFYKSRPAGFVLAKFGAYSYPGETVSAELPPRELPARAASWDEEGIKRSYRDHHHVTADAFRGRSGGRRLLVARGGGRRDTEDAVLGTLRGLAANQFEDGSWGDSEASTPAGTLGPVAITGLATLSYLGAGYTHLSKDTYDGRSYGVVVRTALQWLMRNRQTSPRIIDRALAAFALAEAYGLTASTMLKDEAQAAVDDVAAQSASDGGWPGGVMSSLFAVLAMKSAQTAELQYPRSRADEALRYFEAVVPANLLESAACALAILRLTNNRGHPQLRNHIETIARQRPTSADLNFMYWYAGSLAVFQFDGPAGPFWRGWNQSLREVLLPLLRNRIIKRTPDESASAALVNTALLSLTTEVYYRYPNVFLEKGGRNSAPLVADTRIRVRFPDTALWVPEIVTDAQGEARVDLQLPDSITTTRLTARGVTRDSRVGEAAARVESKLDLFVQIKSPEFFVAGDESEIRAEVHNYTGRRVEVALRLSGEGFECDRREQSCTVTDLAVASWRVKVVDRVRFVVEADGGSVRDACEKRVPVLVAGRERIILLRESGRHLKFKAPGKPLDMVLRIHPRGSPLSKILDALRYLNDYPYG